MRTAYPAAVELGQRQSGSTNRNTVPARPLPSLSSSPTSQTQPAYSGRRSTARTRTRTSRLLQPALCGYPGHYHVTRLRHESRHDQLPALEGTETGGFPDGHRPPVTERPAPAPVAASPGRRSRDRAAASPAWPPIATGRLATALRVLVHRVNVALVLGDASYVDDELVVAAAEETLPRNMTFEDVTRPGQYIARSRLILRAIHGPLAHPGQSAGRSVVVTLAATLSLGRRLAAGMVRDPPVHALRDLWVTLARRMLDR